MQRVGHQEGFNYQTYSGKRDVRLWVDLLSDRFLFLEFRSKQTSECIGNVPGRKGYELFYNPWNLLRKTE